VSIIGPSGMEEVGAEMAGLLRFDIIYGGEEKVAQNIQ